MSMQPLGDRLEAEQLDPLQSPAFRDRLKGADVAFDGRRMQEMLQAALLGKDAAHTIEGCRVSQAIYLAREERCNLVYELKVRDAHSRAITKRVVCARIFTKRVACEDYLRDRLAPLGREMAGRPELAPFATPVAMLEPHHMVASVFPVDGDLPALVGAADPQRMSAVFREVLPPANGGSVDPCRVEVVRYRARKRCVLRYVIERSEPVVVYGKVLQQPASGDVAEAMLALGAVARGGNGVQEFHVPRPLRYEPDPQLALVEGIPGDPRRIKRLLRKRGRGVAVSPGKLTLEGALDVCGRIAAALHGSGIPLGRHHTFERELRRLRGMISDVEPFAPDFGRRLLGWHAQLEAHARRSKPMTAGFSHGDFSLSQFLFDHAVGGLVDFDTLCQAEPARDLGHFLGYLRVGATRQSEAAPTPFTEALRERFLGAYLAASHHREATEEQLRARVALYEASTLLGLTMRSWVKFKTPRLEHASAILDSLELMVNR